MDFKIKLFMNWNNNQAFMSVHDRESIFNNQKSIFSKKNDDGYVMIPINKESFTNETLNYCRQVLKNTIIE